MKYFHQFILALVLVIAVTGNSMAGKPTVGEGIFNGNGFPSGPHYNLMFHGKKDSYLCSPEKWVCLGDSIEYGTEGDCTTTCLDSCEQVYGNVINMPFDNVEGDVIDPPIEILIESGKKGPKGADVDTLQVTDACAGFPTDDPQASFRLPKNEDGYAVYVRIMGKKGEDTKAIFTSPNFSYVEDEAGNDLILLGAVIGNELVEIDEENITVYRSETNSNGKGNKVPKATRLTPLFMWTGTLCYFESYDPDTDFDYCLDYTMDPPSNVCVSHELCCTDVGCDLLLDIGVDPGDGSLVCPETYVAVTASCREYTEDQWVFNIADFVGMLWEIGNNNSYNIQIRFYPLPLNSE